eukprot:symbB.v1.2.030154.t1/scaffold3368.1/size58328/1
MEATHTKQLDTLREEMRVNQEGLKEYQGFMIKLAQKLQKTDVKLQKTE